MALLTISATQRHTGALRYSLAISAQPGADSNHWKETILSKLTQNYNLFPHCFLKKGKGDWNQWKWIQQNSSGKISV